MNIGNQIATIRKEQQLTQEKFGKRFQIGKTKKVIQIYKHLLI